MSLKRMRICVHNADDNFVCCACVCMRVAGSSWFDNLFGGGQHPQHAGVENLMHHQQVYAVCCGWGGDRETKEVHVYVTELAHARICG